VGTRVDLTVGIYVFVVRMMVRTMMFFLLRRGRL
jgi:hypothetical protein